jgi:hypothetical protein
MICSEHTAIVLRTTIDSCFLEGGGMLAVVWGSERLHRRHRGDGGAAASAWSGVRGIRPSGLEDSQRHRRCRWELPEQGGRWRESRVVQRQRGQSPRTWPTDELTRTTPGPDRLRSTEVECVSEVKGRSSRRVLQGPFDKGNPDGVNELIHPGSSTTRHSRIPDRPCAPDQILRHGGRRAGDRGGTDLAIGRSGPRSYTN